MTIKEMVAWLKSAARGDRSIYHVGHDLSRVGDLAEALRDAAESGFVCLTQQRLTRGENGGQFAYYATRTGRRVGDQMDEWLNAS